MHMPNMIFRSAFCLIVTFLLISTSMANILAMEKQIFYRTKTGKIVIRKRPSAKGNASFKKPFTLPWSVQTSMAIFAYLDANDVDVFRFELNGGDGKNSPEGINDYQQAMQLFNSSVPFVIANALPPACKETENDFPAIGLVTPKYGSTNVPLFDTKDLGLNFDIPKGYAIHPVLNVPPKQGEKRLIFSHPEQQGKEHLNVSWFLPEGCFYRGNIPSPPNLNCSNSKSLIAPVYNPFISYYIVVWNPAGTAMDYTLNVGINEQFYRENLAIENAIRNNNHLHKPCTKP